MLASHDFCGYYDWTFHHLRTRFGQEAVAAFWAQAVGLDAQQHYGALGASAGMRGLFEAWRHTGVVEECDWTFTFDETRNVLRWDMRVCPSKGFLLANDRHADEDYCDHCVGWEQPMLDEVGMEIVVHEHNHCGQCWGEIRVKGKPYQPLEIAADIQKDPRWAAGHLDRFADGVKISADAFETIRAWRKDHPGDVILSADAYVLTDAANHNSPAVLFESPPTVETLCGVARRMKDAVAAPLLLLYPYFPNTIDVHFIDYGLPRPLPILPLLIRERLYDHAPHAQLPTTEDLIAMLERALGRTGR